MPHVLVAGRIHPAGLDLLRAAPDITVDAVDEVSTEAYVPRIADADALLIRTQPLPAAVIATAPRLRIVSRHGVGFDAVDVPALDARGITLAIVGDVNSRPVAEHAMALIMALSKRLVVFDAGVRGDGWASRNGFSAWELSGKRLLLVGFGRIGRLVAGMAAAFGMAVSAYDPFQSPDAIRAGGAAPVSNLLEGLGAADLVSLHVPKAEGRALIGAAELAALPAHAILVNTARGDLIDEDALADALESGKLAGAGIDVFAQEPPPSGSRLLRSDQVVLTPHTAALTRECAARMSQVAAQNILDFFAGTLDPALTVDTAAGRR